MALTCMGVTLRGWEGPGRCGSLREEDARASSHRQPSHRCRPRSPPPGSPLAAASASHLRPRSSGPPPRAGSGGLGPLPRGAKKGVPSPPVARPVPGLRNLERDPTPQFALGPIRDPLFLPVPLTSALQALSAPQKQLPPSSPLRGSPSPIPPPPPPPPPTSPSLPLPLPRPPPPPP